MNQRMLVAALLSAGTIVGGHLYNEKPYKALTFLSLTVIAPILLGIVGAYFASDHTGEELVTRFRIVSWTFVVVFVALHMVSLIVAAWDALSGGVPETQSQRYTAFTLALLAAMLMLFGEWLRLTETLFLTAR